MVSWSKRLNVQSVIMCRGKTIRPEFKSHHRQTKLERYTGHEMCDCTFFPANSYFLWCKKNVALILIARSSSTDASTKNYPSHILQSNILVTLYILRFRLYNARGMNSLSFPTTHFIAIWRKKHKCMENVPTFSAVLFFEVEVATDNRHFRPERIEIAKRGERHKKRARC